MRLKRKTTDDPWQKLTFAEFADLARRIAGSLVDGEVFPQAVVKGESIAIAGPTRSEWFQISMGAQYSGGVTVGVYPRQSRESLSYLLAHSEARVFFLDDPSDLQHTAAAKIAGDLPQLHSIVTWTDELASDAKSVAASKAAGLRLLPLSALTGHGPISPIDLASRRPQSIDDTAVLVYTSGTTGHPKVCVLPACDTPENPCYILSTLRKLPLLTSLSLRVTCLVHHLFSKSSVVFLRASCLRMGTSSPIANLALRVQARTKALVEPAFR